jgi:hypothetical protein
MNVLKNFISSTIILFTTISLNQAQSLPKNTYEELIHLAKEVRMLERTALPSGVPDYRPESITKIQSTLTAYQTRHTKIDTVGWAIPQKVDYVLLWAEMNALDFNCRVLKPWQRDPTFYAIIFTDQSDTPDHEGPTSFAAIELWKYIFPLNKEDTKKLIAQLKIIPPLFEQAQANLTGNARDLWEVGIENIKDQIRILDDLAQKTSQNGKEMQQAIQQAKNATTKLMTWLVKELPNKKGVSGIGKENYNWHLRNVLLTSLTWDDEVALLTRELARSYASLQMERERNRGLPELKAYTSLEEYRQKTDLAVKEMMAFLQDKKILPVKAYMESELRKHLGSFVPEEKRNFFANISHRAPAVLYSHLTHWFEIAQLTHEPHPSFLRREPLPFNIWMMRDEGLATAFEEILMQAGMWDNNSRARELVWIMLAQRCARGLASLYAQANMIDYNQARKFQVEWTPKGWTGDESLVGFEQHLYLRQPAYGTSYVSGKYLLEGLIMDVSRKQGNSFSLYQFFEEFYNVGIIPVSLVRWQMTGMEDEIKKIVGK